MHGPPAGKSLRPRDPETKQQKNTEKIRGKSQKRKTATKSGRRGSETAKDRKQGEQIELSRARESPPPLVADYDFGFDFYEETQGFMLGVGESDSKNRWRLFALAPLVAPSSRKPVGGPGNGEQPNARVLSPDRWGPRMASVFSTPSPRHVLTCTKIRFRSFTISAVSNPNGLEPRTLTPTT